MTAAFAVVMPAAALAQSASTASIQRTDSRGYINPWALRAQILDLLAMPNGQEECSSGQGDEDAESTPVVRTRNAQLAYERKLKKRQQAAAKAILQCERNQQKLRNRYASALGRLNKTWLPLLQRASDRGDSVAEFILRSCEAASLLDRKNVVSDCSEREVDRRYARHVIEAMGFKPALHGRTVTAHAEFLREENSACGQRYSGDKPNLCAYRNDIERYQRILSVMRTGYFGVVEGHNTCQMHGPTEESDRMVEACQRLFYLVTGLAGQTSWFYSSLSLDRPRRNGDENYFGAITAIIADRGTLPRIDWSKFSDPEFTPSFYRELEQAKREIESNIAAELRHEPRWKVFLTQQRYGRLNDTLPDDAIE